MLANRRAFPTPYAWLRSYCRRWMGAGRLTSTLKLRTGGAAPETDQASRVKEHVMFIGGGLLLLILIILLLVILF